MYQNRTKQTQSNYRSYFQAVKLILARFLEKNECGTRTYDQGFQVCNVESMTYTYALPPTAGIGETGKASAPCGGSVRGISGLLIDSGGNCQQNKPNRVNPFLICKMSRNGTKQTQRNYPYYFQSVVPILARFMKKYEWVKRTFHQGFTASQLESTASFFAPPSATAKNWGINRKEHQERRQGKGGRNKPGMCRKISGITPSRLYQGFNLRAMLWSAAAELPPFSAGAYPSPGRWQRQ
jgi:hypothetical protein